MITYVGHKGSPIRFDGNDLDAIAARPEETRAIVETLNGRFAVAHYSYRQFDDVARWVIWNDDEYSSQFRATMDLDLVSKIDGKWIVRSDVRRIAA
jgi:hypothetical protein